MLNAIEAIEMLEVRKDEIQAEKIKKIETEYFDWLNNLENKIKNAINKGQNKIHAVLNHELKEYLEYFGYNVEPKVVEEKLYESNIVNGDIISW